MPIADTSYKGSRFFKCDLQVNTPGDAGGWVDSNVTLDSKGAAIFVEKCIALGLECIAITDHNFCSQEFIENLAEAAANKNLVIFPGFEIQANVGRGVHVLAIFEPDSILTDLSHVLTQCGIEPPRKLSGGQWKKSNKDLKALIDIVQGPASRRSKRGLVILPHILSNDGLFDNDSVSEVFQYDEFRNEDLLAVEIPKPINKMNGAFQRLFENGEDCDPVWRRERKIACIMSSDGRSFEEQEDGNGHIGRRSTWIKMSAPSIEALRQAFLDPDSRIRTTVGNPDDTYTYPYVKSVRIENVKFMKDLKVSFSKNLNTFIGGRGCGKSTVLEYVNMLLTAAGGGSNISNECSRRAAGTLTQDSRIEIEIVRDGQEWTVAKNGMHSPEVVKGSAIDDIPTFFSIDGYSQGQPHEIAARPEQQRLLIEKACEEDLKDLYERASGVKQQISKLTNGIGSRDETTQRRSQLNARLAAVKMRIESIQNASEEAHEISDLHFPLKVYDRIKDAEQAIKLNIENGPGAVESIITALEYAKEDVPPQIFYRLVEMRTNSERLSQRVLDALALWVDDTSTSDLNSELEEYLNESREKYESYKNRQQTLVDSGADVENVTSYQEDGKSLEERIAVLDKTIESTGEMEELRQSRLAELEQIWEDEYQYRLSAANEINLRVPSIGTGGHKIVRVSVIKYGSSESCGSMLRGLHIDRRSLSDDDLSEIASNIVAEAVQVQRSPTAILRETISKLRRDEKPPFWPWKAADRRSIHFTDKLNEEHLWQTYCTRVDDLIEITLFRSNGQEVGTVSGQVLSTGQQCTALLCVIMAATCNPVLIDQPEDDLDNSFIYSELVPLIRQLKERRQIIIATHNANLPVNADAENVVALEVDDGKGVIVEYDKMALGAAVGGIDRGAVQFAISEIMEGSKQAFLKRREKYGF